MAAAIALMSEGIEGETSHSLITWSCLSCLPIDGNIFRLVLGAITNKHVLIIDKIVEKPCYGGTQN